MQTPGSDITPCSNVRKLWQMPVLRTISIVEITKAGTSTGPDAPCNTGFGLPNC